MKITSPASILTLLLLCLALTPAAAAQSSSGLYQFTVDDSYMKYLDFNARTQADGSATGELYLSDEAPVTFQDVDGVGDRTQTGTVKGFYVKAVLDDLVVDRNQAVMSGVVRDSSMLELVGLRVLLTVVDNGDNLKVPDYVTWGFYRTEKRAWTPSDAELKEDPGVGLRWLATDAERKDDEGYWMPREEAPAGAKTFTLASYEFFNASRASGDIAVNP
ncbi:MAG TPA: hypothetical protein VF668_22105 [Pyrinomonadaceae bacterium]|jgi:hypothetical protein